MAGTNPFIKNAEVALPERPYRITFEPVGRTIEVDPAKLPYHRTGRKGSILEIALGNGVDIDHACGGVVACSTCHVIVKQGLDTCNEATDDEEDQLDLAPGLTPKSRLACQTVPDGTEEVVIEIPGWNRNLVRESPH
jgi:ferredoxin, 2Fe-2S